jgi:hypothetical protein
MLRQLDQRRISVRPLAGQLVVVGAVLQAMPNRVSGRLHFGREPTMTKPTDRPFWTYNVDPRDLVAEVWRNGEVVGSFRSPVKGAARRFAIRIVRSLNTGKVQR